MAGLAAFMGGVGGAAGQYNDQMRFLLEQNRQGLANHFFQLAQAEGNPDRRSQYLQTGTDLLSSAPFHGIIPKVVKLFQGHQKDDQAMSQLSQMIGQMGPKQTSTPANVPGAVPGTGAVVKTEGAAQPSSSPVSPQAQGGAQIGGTGNPLPGNIGVQQSDQPASPAAQSALQSMIAPQQAGPMEQARAYRSNLIQQYNQKTMNSTPAMRPILEQQLQQELASLAPFEQQALRSQQFQDLSSSPEYKASPGLIQLGYRAQAGGFQPISMMGALGAMTGVNTQRVDAKSLEAQHPGILAKYNIDPTKTPVVEVTYNRYALANGMMEPELVNGINPGYGTYTGETGNQFVGPKVPGIPSSPTAGNAVAPSQVAPRQVTLPTGQTGFTNAVEAQAGTAPTPNGGINTAMVPTTTTSQRLITMQGPDGPVQVFEPVTTQRTRGISAAPLPPAPSSSAPGQFNVPPGPNGEPGFSVPPPASGGGGRSFPKAFTPEEQLKHQQQLGQYNLAIDRMTSIQSKLHLLDSMMESGKLNLELDSNGLVRALVNRALPLTPAEAEFIGDFRTMMEDINLLRGPMGATGFRGPEAWAALQAQRGQLLAHPEVTRQVLKNSIAALKNQQQPLDKSFGQAAGQSAPTRVRVYDPATGTLR